jgi:hypothetical protein
VMGRASRWQARMVAQMLRHLTIEAGFYPQAAVG